MDDDDVEFEFRRGWHAALSDAAFTPFEAVGGSTTLRWAGGWGGGDEGTTHLQVMSLIDGVEVSVLTVDTTRYGVRPTRTVLLHDLIGQYTLEQDDVAFPFSLTVLQDDRELMVGDESVVFNGLHIDGESRWAGHAELDGLTAEVKSAAPIEFTIRRCSDGPSLPELPPDATD